MLRDGRQADMVAIKFSYADVDPASGKRVGESLFAELSQHNQTFLWEVLGIPEIHWDQMVSAGCPGYWAGCEPLTYLVPRALFGGAR